MSFEQQVQRVMDELGLEYPQAVRHVQQRQWLASRPAPTKEWQ